MPFILAVSRVFYTFHFMLRTFRTNQRLASLGLCYDVSFYESVQLCSAALFLWTQSGWNSIYSVPNI